MFIDDNWKLIYKGREYDCEKPPMSCFAAADIGTSDFYKGEDQYLAAELAREGCVFRTVFRAEDTEASVLLLDRVDTLAEVRLNGTVIGECDNMFRTFAFQLPIGLLKAEGNTLEIEIKPPVPVAEQAYEKRPIYGVFSTLPGYPHIRKAHYMYGWDWGAVIPDMGVYGRVELRRDEYELFADVKQTFADDYSFVKVEVTPVMYSLLTGKRVSPAVQVDVSLEGVTEAAEIGKPAIFSVDDPALWYPNGYGNQPLYTVSLSTEDGREKSFQIGLRNIRLCRDKLEDGEDFCFEVNGKRIFARGANYIPQDNIIPKVNEEKTQRLLLDMRNANYCMVRVWGGGYYPEDFFFSLCDRLGLLVWQDFMFACAAYDFDEKALDGIYREACDNILRIKNHACLALWCGNNEIESMWEGWGVPDDPKAQGCYRRIFGSEGVEGVLPKAIADCCSDTPYHPSSPSSGGGLTEGSQCFKNSSAPTIGDSHFWAVWHSLKPVEFFKQNTLRFCSEFGFESLPDYKTVRYFAGKDEPNLTESVMEAHQKGEKGSEKLMYYIAAEALIPATMKGMVYVSQLVQAECIRGEVEYLRQNRGDSMGALYWQVNDCAPVISWSSIDYFGGKKALHYYAERFFAPLLISCREESGTLTFNASSELTEKVDGVLAVALRGADGKKLRETERRLFVEPLSQRDVLSIDISDFLEGSGRRECFAEFSASINGEEVYRNTALFVRPKEFGFADCRISCNIAEGEDFFLLTLRSEGFVHAAALSHDRYVLDLSDNWVDVLPDKPFDIAISKRARKLDGSEVWLTAEDIGGIEIMHCGNYYN